MPFYDTICRRCSHEREVFANKRELIEPCQQEYSSDTGSYKCEGYLEVVPSRGSNVIGAELDYIDDNLGPVPIHIRSREQRAAIMKERGLVEFVRHVPVPGTDKSPHTTNWGAMMDPQTMANATALLERVGRAKASTPDEPDFVMTGGNRAVQLSLGATYSCVLDVKLAKEVK